MGDHTWRTQGKTGQSRKFDKKGIWETALHQREIRSAYYDKNMVTHYWSEQGVLVAKSFVGVTKVLAHSFPTTFTFLKMLIKQIKEEHTALKVVHFISDGPSS